MEQTSKRATFDDILEVLGEFGTFQKLVYYAFSLTYVFTSMQLMGWVFVGARVPFKCNDSYSSNFTSSCLDSNGSECDVGFVYDESLGVDSVVREWDLVCSRSSLHAVAGAASMVGCLMGGWTIGVFSDHVGRRPAFVFSMVLLALAGTGATSAPGSLYGFVAARVIVGFALAGAEGSAFVMGMELVGPRKRTHAGIICWFFETAGLLTALLLAYLFQSDWRVLQLTYSAPCVIFVVYHWLTPESVRWLLSKGHRDEAIRVIERSAKVNGVDLPAGMVEQLEIVDRDQQAASTLDLFRHKHLRIKTVILAACWTVCASLYYVLLLDQSELSDDPYVGFLINCAVQVPGYVFVLMTLERSSFGRRKSQCGFLIVTGVTLFGHPFFPDSRLTRCLLHNSHLLSPLHA